MYFLVIPMLIQMVGVAMAQDSNQIIEYYKGHSAKKGPGAFFGKMTKEEADHHGGGVIVAYYSLDKKLKKSETRFGKNVVGLTEMEYDDHGKLLGFKTTRFGKDNTTTIKKFDALGNQLP